MKNKKIILSIVVVLSILCISLVIKMQFGKNDALETLKEYSPIACLDDKIVYGYFNEDNVYVIGYYTIDTESLTDVAFVENFYISKGNVTVMQEKIYLPITLGTGEHIVLEMDVSTGEEGVLFAEDDGYGLDTLSTMNDELYMLSGHKDVDETITYFVRKYNPETNEMDICIQKSSQRGESIEAFSCYNGIIYTLVKTNNDIVMELYDEEGKFLDTVEMEDEVKERLEYGVVQFYVWDNFFYLRDYTDEGMIAQIIQGEAKTIFSELKLRYAEANNYNGTHQILFMREGKELYILNLSSGEIETVKLDLAQGESIRNVVTDGMTLCVSVLDENNKEDYETKEIRIIDIMSYGK